jgi:hypothetical protein
MDSITSPIVIKSIEISTNFEGNKKESKNKVLTRLLSSLEKRVKLSVKFH